MITTPKYTRDLLPAEFSNDTSAQVHRFQFIEERARDLFRRYGFKEIRTPIFEHTELFARGVGTETDIVSKEMYTWKDINGDSLTLRPENTASVIRAYIQHKMWGQAETVKLFYVGPQFRRERGQKGRFRQFYQIGAEVIGNSDNPAIDAECIEMIMQLVADVGIGNAELRLNSVGDAESRPRFAEMIRRELAPKISSMCGDCQRRYETNPLRILDCKLDHEVVAGLPSTLDLLTDDARQHFETVCRYLDARGISYKIDSRLVRGLDYYTKTVFEVVSGSLGSQNALLGGGRYDGLSKELGGPAAKGFGFALGLDRFAMTIPENSGDQGNPDLYIAHLGAAAFERALVLVQGLRKKGIAAAVDFETRSLKSSMKLADKLKARYVLILGESELASGQWALRSMKDSSQSTISAENWLEEITNLVGAEEAV
ncbi:MAG: histidine--tRNA ligase [Blastocatellia bacterium]|nr:histidine--tRNA ligase [Blastocatellia bacterium]